MTYLDVLKLAATIMVPLFFGWRYQMIEKRKFEIAEKALCRFKEAILVLHSVRHPAGYGNEGVSRPPQDGETEDQRAMRNTYYVPIERLNRHSELFGQVEKDETLVGIYFGSDAKMPYRSLRDIHFSIAHASGWLMRMTHRREALDPRIKAERDERRVKFEAIIWDDFGDGPDATRAILNRLDTEITAILTPPLDAHHWIRWSTWEKLGKRIVGFIRGRLP